MAEMRWLALLALTMLGCSSGRARAPSAAPDKQEPSTQTGPRPPALPDANQLMDKLYEPSTRLEAITQIKSSAERVEPPVLFKMAALLFDGGKRDEAAFWYLIAIIRSKADSRRCPDESTRQAVVTLNSNFGRGIEAYFFSKQSEARTLLDKVLQWDETHAYAYDPTWIAHAIIDAQSAPMAKETWKLLTHSHCQIVSSEAWPEIIQKNRASFANAVGAALEAQTRGRLIPKP